MKDVRDISGFIGMVVDRLFLIMWPPLGEENTAQVDLSFGFSFANSNGYIYVLTTSKEDVWTPVLIRQRADKIFNATEFWSRVEGWMKEDINEEFEYEFYDVSSWEMFQGIVKGEIKDIKMMRINGDTAPFGLKVEFEGDYILTFPNSYSNTVKTSQFDVGADLRHFYTLGEVEYISIR
jgi:hypothetical protein